MTLPHQCRCAICGEIGVITPGLPNVFADMPRAYGGTGKADVPPEGVERRAIVPTETSLTDAQLGAAALAVVDGAYASSRADFLAPRTEVPYAEIPTCTHGYTRCMPCKFPPDTGSIQHVPV